MRFRTTFASSLIALAIPLGLVRAQKAPQPDSVAAIMLSPVLVRLLASEIASAGRGYHHILKLDFPQSDAWSRIATHLLTISGGRAPDARDSTYESLAVKHIRSSADTVIATIVKETLDLCPKHRWMTTGTEYEVRIVRVGQGWTQPRLTPGLTWDAFGCPDA